MSQRLLWQQPRNSYCDLDEPSFDEYIYCDKCSDYVYEYCSIHGPLLVIPDEKVPAKSVFPPTVPRAALTIPHVFLHIRPSSIPGAGLGVFATLTLPKGVHFGPYCGRRTREIKSVYCWQIYNADNKPLHLVDGHDEQVANWMRYVNCARHSLEQNLVAYQYQGEIYYRTIKTIRGSAELLVFYGSEFADSLNVDLGKYNSKKHYLQAIGKSPETEVQSKRHGHQKLYSSEATSTTIEVSRDVDMRDDTPVENITDNAIDYVIDDDFQYINEDSVITEYNTQDDAIISADQRYDDIKLHDDDSQTDFNKTNTEKRVTYANVKATENNIEMGKTDLRNQPSTSINLLDLNAKEIELGNNAKNVFDSKMILDGKYKNYFTVITGDSDKVQWECKECHKTIICRKSLKIHALTHTDIKLYKCLECEYKTNQKRDIYTHMVKHTGEFIKCEFCGFATNAKTHLKRHIKLIHLKEQPKCEFCNYKVIQKTLMESHRKLHGLKNAMKCGFCDYLYIKKQYLTRHVQAMHEKRQTKMPQQ